MVVSGWCEKGKWEKTFGAFGRDPNQQEISKRDSRVFTLKMMAD
jgi:hypothetical protein